MSAYGFSVPKNSLQIDDEQKAESLSVTSVREIGNDNAVYSGVCCSYLPVGSQRLAMVPVDLEAAAVGQDRPGLKTLLPELVVDGSRQGVLQHLVRLGYRGEGVERVFAASSLAGQPLRVKSQGQTTKPAE